MLPAEKAIVQKYFQNKNSHPSYGSQELTKHIIAEVKLIDKAMTGKDNETCTVDFLNEIIQHCGGHKHYHYHNPTLIAEIFMMTQETDLSHDSLLESNTVKTNLAEMRQKVFQCCLSGPSYRPYYSSSFYQKLKLRNEELHLHLISAGHDMRLMSRECLQNIVKYMVEPLDVSKMETLKKNSAVINTYFYANVHGKLPSDFQLNAAIIDKFFSSDLNLIMCAWEQQNFKAIHLMFRHFKVTPKNEHFNKILHEVRFWSKGYNNEGTKIIDTMVAQGFKLSLENIKKAVDNRVFINNIQNYVNTAEDRKDLTAHCYAQHYYHYPEIFGISSEMAHLYRLCTSNTSSYSAVKEMVKRGLQPDRHALKLACGNVHQKKLVGFLVNIISPDVECFQAMCDAFDPSGVLSKVNTMVNKRLSSKYKS
jgi:hypothetical protein